MDGDQTSPLRLSLQVASLSRDGGQIAYAASEIECAKAAEALGIDSVASIRADLVARPFRKDGARVSGRLRAVVVQKSVVSLEPVEQTIDEEFEATYVRGGRRTVDPSIDAAGEIFVDPEADDPPETFSGDRIDLGERLFETLTLALDPYPRRPGEGYGGQTAEEAPDEDEDTVVSPFAALAKFTPSRGDGED
ncbi:DUF177 domain-containing protein [Jiella avicenniae]|uniref:DUF177 domain-containing protein n=1 Tax=Jiella avicenniae TaxID=2907202 RepID=A0A9X1T3M0_9HYPH|nr:DUF177 domain-containing protein [Jiella avicenniae]MCE7027761.1 DUF177 domain-containing protein [Jiella avicenniae]MCE7028803.1 DUF177 domain-containing protein [Jiella avicenniae]